MISVIIIRRKIFAALLSFFLSPSNALAQERPAHVSNTSTVTITGSATDNQVRFAAPSSIVQLRLEVYNAAGRKLFDNELRGGNILDWPLRDGHAEPLADGLYLCLITVKSFSGKLAQTIASLRVEKGIAGVQPTTAAQVTSQQAEAIGPVEEIASLIVVKEAEQPAATVIVHNGEDGQITRGRGALSFRIGDFYSGKDDEQMRLSAEGNLGIGITHPQVRLEVDGFIRATRGIVFPDGSVQFSAARKTFGAESLGPGQPLDKIARRQEHAEATPNTSGTGTSGKIAKWQDGPAGVLNDSNITEVSGAIGINASPDTRFRLDVHGSTRIRGSNPGFNLEGQRPAGNIWLFQTVDDDGRFRLFSQDNVNPGVERLTIKLDTGHVGIGTPSPTHTLDVNGFFRAWNVAGGNVVSETTGGTNSWAKLWVKTPNQQWSIGSSNNFNGNQLYFSNETASGIQMAIMPGGNVGIGTTNPFTRLEVVQPNATQMRFGVAAADSGGYLISTLPSQAIIAGGARWNATNWIARDQSASLIAQLNGVIQFLTDTGLTSGTSFNPTERMKIDQNGNITQPHDSSGLPKAMVYVTGGSGNATIARCYNGTTGASTGNCGTFSVTSDVSGYYLVNFGFDVTGRFFSLTTSGNDEAITGRIRFISSTTVAVYTFRTATFDENVVSDFFLIVY